jgi:tetratricopeptide (TPR) repeat protein
MLTSQRAFSKGSFALTVTAILMDPAPEVHASGVEVTQELNRIIGRCLEKNPMERFQSASDLAFALRSLLVEKQGVRAPAEAAHFAVAGSALVDSGKEKRRIEPNTSGMKGKWLSRMLIPAALICILAIAALLWISGKGEITLSVLPSDNEASDNSGYDASLYEKLNQKISELEIVRVRPLLARQSLSGMGQDFVAIADKFKASALLRWHYTLSGEDLEIYIELIDGRTGLTLDVNTFPGKSYQVMEPITRIARHVVEKLRPRLGKAEKDKLECLSLYGRGQDELANRTPDSLKRAIRYFEDAVKRNPNFARAYVGIADSYNMLGIYGADNPAKLFQDGLKAANQALKIDNLLAEAHTSRGFAIERHDFARQGAQREYSEAIKLSSSNRDARAAAYHRWGVCLIDLGQYEEAIEKIRQAQEKDPSSQIMQSDLSRAYLYKGDLKEAIRISTATIERFPKFAPAYRYRGLAYEQAKDFPKAIADLQEAMRLSRNSPLMKGDLGHVYASAGLKDEARSILSELQRDRGNGLYRSCFLIAQICACLEDREEALNHLERALEEKDPFILSLEVDPILRKTLGNEPRFRQLTAQLAQR